MATSSSSESIDQANAEGDLNLISDNLSSHTSAPIQQWLAAHPRVHPVPLPTGACWLNLQEGWWRLFRREALAGQSFADAKEIDLGDARGDGASQRAGQALDLGPPAPSTPSPAASFCLLPLRNGALETVWEGERREGRGEREPAAMNAQTYLTGVSDAAWAGLESLFPAPIPDTIETSVYAPTIGETIRAAGVYIVDGSGCENVI